MDEPVAVKMILKTKISDANKLHLIQMMHDEAELMHKLKHPRIGIPTYLLILVRFITMDIPTFSMILEFMPGGSLISHIKTQKSKFMWADRLQIMLDICEGMAYLHASLNEDGSTKPRVYHQDLKSGNVLLKMEGRLRGKIADFGLAG
jgi:serine/threonine protein kinase